MPGPGMPGPARPYDRAGWRPRVNNSTQITLLLPDKAVNSQEQGVELMQLVNLLTRWCNNQCQSTAVQLQLQAADGWPPSRTHTHRVRHIMQLLATT